MKKQTFFCPQLERKVSAKEFEEAKQIYISNVKTPKISVDWKAYEIDENLLDEVFYYALKFGYKASKYENENEIPQRAIRKYRNKIAERIADYVITSDAAETFSDEDYVKKLGIKLESVGDYEKMMTESIAFILNKYKGKDMELLDKEIKLYGNSVMSEEFNARSGDIKFNSSNEYIVGKK